MSSRLLCGAAVLLLASFACLYRLGAPTLEMWDEARLANSALEMLGNGRWLTPHYAGAPDHWSTKPPLMIWLMAGSMDLFGVHDWAARLPAALCGLLLIVGLHAWVSRVTGTPMAGVVAALCLACTPGFLLDHGARAAEYDAPLALAMMGAVYAMHRWTDPAQPARWAPALLALCMLAGTMTKTVQALIIVPPLMLWWATRPKRPPVWRADVLVPALLVVLALALYVYARGQDDPHYLAATWNNDIAGRFTEPQEGHDGHPLWYLTRVRYFPLLIPGLVAWGATRLRREPEIQRLADLVLMVEIGYLLVISASATKLTWYALPTAPMSAILVALGSRALWRRWMRDDPGAWLAPADGMKATRRAALVLAVWTAAAATFITYRIDWRERMQRVDTVHRLDHLLRAVEQQLPHDGPIAVLQPGVRSPHTPEPYVAATLFYVQALRMQGWRIDIINALSEIRPEHRIVVQCIPTDQERHLLMDTESWQEGCTVEQRAQDHRERLVWENPINSPQRGRTRIQ